MVFLNKSLECRHTNVVLWDPGFIKFKQELEYFPLDWRPTKHWNVFFWKFSNLTTYVRVDGTFSETHFNVSLFSNPGEKFLKIWRSTEQICLLLSTRIRTFSPRVENNNTLVWHMWSNWRIVGTTFQWMVVVQSRGKYLNSCLNFMKPGSQSKTYTVGVWGLNLRRKIYKLWILSKNVQSFQ